MSETEELEKLRLQNARYKAALSECEKELKYMASEHAMDLGDYSRHASYVISLIKRLKEVDDENKT
jgi:hypothetical protein